MKTTVIGGIALGVLVVLWTFVMGFTGWYKDPALPSLFLWVAIPVQIVVLIWGLRRTANDGCLYWPQVGNGVLVSVIGAVIIFCGSYLFTTVFFPQYFDEIRALGTETMKAQGKSEAEIKQLMDAAAPTQTPIMNALRGVIGTVVTGFVVSLAAAAFLRRKE